MRAYIPYSVQGIYGYVCVYVEVEGGTVEGYPSHFHFSTTIWGGSRTSSGHCMIIS